MNAFDLYIKLYNGKLPTERDPDYLELLRMHKYRILAVPDAKPSKCANCGSTKEDGRNYVDFGLDVDWYGTVYLCGLCLKDIATKMNLFADLEEKLKVALQKCEQLDILNTRGVELTSAVATIFEEVKEYYSQLYTAGVDIPTDSSAGSSVVENTSESGIDTSEQRTEGTQSRAAKSNSVSGRKNVPSLTSLLGSD